MEIVLKELELAKQMFVLELINKFETDIPDQLMQNNLPMSFQFYDSTFPIVHNLTNQRYLTEQNCKHELNIKRCEDDDNMMRKLMEMMSITRFF